MSGFVDLDVHILPGIDDGAQRREESLEMRMCAALSRTARSGGDLAPYTLNQNGRYLLFDLPFSEVPLLTLDACFSLRLQGIQPVLAHPERNRELASKGPLLKSFITSGLLVQIDSGGRSLVEGQRGRGPVATRFIYSNPISLR